MEISVHSFIPLYSSIYIFSSGSVHSGSVSCGWAFPWRVVCELVCFIHFHAMPEEHSQPTLTSLGQRLWNSDWTDYSVVTTRMILHSDGQLCEWLYCLISWWEQESQIRVHKPHSYFDSTKGNNSTRQTRDMATKTWIAYSKSASHVRKYKVRKLYQSTLSVWRFEGQSKLKVYCTSAPLHL